MTQQSSFKNDADIADSFTGTLKDNNDIMLQWVTFDELKELTIYPAYIKDKIANISSGIEHFVRNAW